MGISPGGPCSSKAIAGYSIGQDISERTVQLRGPAPQFSLGKSFPGFAPVGPVFVTPDELIDPDDLAITSTLAGGADRRKPWCHLARAGEPAS